MCVCLEGSALFKNEKNVFFFRKKRNSSHTATPTPSSASTTASTNPTNPGASG
jgi:hypothetical protein